MKRLLGPAILTIALAIPSTASAGTYNVYACNASVGDFSWSGEPTSTGSTFSHCPGEGIVTRNVTSNTPAPHWAGARTLFRAPAGTNIIRFQGNVDQNAIHGWWAGLVDHTGNFIWGGANGTTWGNWKWTDVWMRTPLLYAQVTCGANTCPRPAHYGLMAMKDVVVTIEDNVPPSVALTGGLKASAGWLRGDQKVSYTASDNTGLRQMQLLVDGHERSAHMGNCSDARAVPCGKITTDLGATAAAFRGDGRHRIVVLATDSALNVREVARTVWVDNTAPTEPVEMTLNGGSAWRSRNAFTVRWRNPAQDASAIAAVRYRLCPVVDSDVPRACTQGAKKAKDVGELSDLRVPGQGEWRLTLWLEDAAGNADPERSVTMRGLGLDETAPAMSFTRPQVTDPTRVTVAASDSISAIGDAWIEARRRGEKAWRSLSTTMGRDGFSAVLDDETMPKGQYYLRARARDLAGNERSIDRMPDGTVAVRSLPIRLGTQLAVGHPKRVRARGANGKLRYRTVLVERPRTRYGRTIPIRGRLTMPGANPLSDADVEVWERIRLSGARWKRVGQVRTSRSGRFLFKALPGASRLLRFRYPGTATIRARAKVVDLRVRAVTSLMATQRSVVNGEEVRFYGRLKGRQRGAVGKLVHLQVYSRGKWSTFATPRANRRTGRWRVPYRFTATRGRVTYRFRALIPRESMFPYDTGVSKSVRVSVAGL